MPKFTFFILSILCLNVSVSAQTNLKMTSSNDLNNDYLDQNHQLKSNLEILTILNDPNQKKCNTYKKMAKSGKIMTFVGGGFGVLSTATTVLGIAILEEDDLGAIAIVGGAVGILLGYGTMTGGGGVGAHVCPKAFYNYR